MHLVPYICLPKHSKSCCCSDSNKDFEAYLHVVCACRGCRRRRRKQGCSAYGGVGLSSRLARRCRRRNGLRGRIGAQGSPSTAWSRAARLGGAYRRRSTASSGLRWSGSWSLPVPSHYGLSSLTVLPVSSHYGLSSLTAWPVSSHYGLSLLTALPVISRRLRTAVFRRYYGSYCFLR